MPALTIENYPELIDEDVIPLSKINEVLPFEIGPHVVQRWMRKGISGICLETFCIGRHRFTSKQAVRRFIARQNGKDDHSPAPVKPSMNKTDLESGRRRFNLPVAGRNGQVTSN